MQDYFFVQYYSYDQIFQVYQKNDLVMVNNGFISAFELRMCVKVCLLFNHKSSFLGLYKLLAAIKMSSY